jgi:hypothetical protein
MDVVLRYAKYRKHAYEFDITTIWADYTKNIFLSIETENLRLQSTPHINEVWGPTAGRPTGRLTASTLQFIGKAITVFLDPHYAACRSVSRGLGMSYTCGILTHPDSHPMLRNVRCSYTHPGLWMYILALLSYFFYQIFLSA